MPHSQPEPAPDRLPFPAYSPGYSSPPNTLLLVEDSRLAAEAVRLICRRTGIRLRRAETLASAALHLKVYRPDIALIDLGLPDGSGLELIRTLLAQHNRPGRIVAISGHADMQEAALDAGADAFLLKPVSMAQHLRALTGRAPCPSADLSALDESLGLGAQPKYADRNSGADPLALRDDLRLVRDLLNGPTDIERLRYVGRFLASVGRALHDDQLARSAQWAVARGDKKALYALVEDWEPVGPVL